ncbi:TRIM2 [Branchiostoma lanceolatum]|uniref:RING-type E3 ubiquitin transferase n=1 Tax=Branchiostoma lanceolatum TaxID=7740 RepID=A0A8K0EHK0_BRALA|nr:TRIM2 [Branchiostoma lanceolatum]
MASRPVASFSSQNHLCKLCSKVFDQPKVLSCLHTFCRGCLENMPTSGGALTCPTCGQNVPLSQDGVHSLRDNTLVAKLFAQKDPNAKVVRASCTDCASSEQDAAFYCFQCMKYLCVSCEEAHRKEDASNRHELWIADNLSEKQKAVAAENSGEAAKCKEHGQVSVLYCNTCHEVLCAHCVVKTHKLHDFVEMTEAREKGLKRIEKGIDEAQFCLENQRRKLEVVEETAKKSSEQYDTSRQQIHERSQYLIQLVRESEERCLKELEENLKSMLESTSGKQEELLDSYKSHIDFSRTLLAHGSPTEILSLGGCLADRLDSLKMKSIGSGNNDPQSTTVSQGLNFEVEREDVTSEIETLFGQVGKIDDSTEETIPRGNREDAVTSLGGLTTQWKSGRPRSFSLAVTTPGDIIVAGQRVLKVINGENYDVKKTVDLTFEPKDVAYSNDNVYVTGDGNKIHVFTSGGAEKDAISVDDEDQRHSTQGIAANKPGYIIVSMGAQVYVLLPNGDIECSFVGSKELKRLLTRKTVRSAWRLYIATNSRNQVIISDPSSNNISIFDMMGNFVSTIAGYGKGDGQLFCPTGVFVAGDDSIIVADCRNDRVSKFGRDGAFIKHVITKHDGLFAPMGVALSRDGRCLIVSSLVGGMPVNIYKI